jgi:hypothetical protein
MGRRRCSKPDHNNPPERTPDGRCRFCVRAANQAYRVRTRELYAAMRELSGESDC